LVGLLMFEILLEFAQKIIFKSIGVS